MSHYDADHVGDIADIGRAAGMTVGAVYDRGGGRDAKDTATYRDYYDWVTARGIRHPVDIGDVFLLCGGAQQVTFTVVSAGTDGTAANGVAVSEENDRGVCLKVSYRDFDLATCGDVNGSDVGSRTDVESAVGGAFGDVDASQGQPPRVWVLVQSHLRVHPQGSGGVHLGGPQPLRASQPGRVRPLGAARRPLLPATSLPDTTPAAQVLACYRSLQQVEVRFRVLKDSTCARVFHWTETRVRGHIAVCVIAAVIEALMGKALREADVRDPDLDHQHLSVRRALDDLGRIRRVTIDPGDGGPTIRLVTRRTRLHEQTLKALKVDTRTWNRATPT